MKNEDKTNIVVDLEETETNHSQNEHGDETPNCITNFKNWFYYDKKQPFSRAKTLTRFGLVSAGLLLILPIGAAFDTFFDNAIINPDLNVIDFLAKLDLKYLGFATGQMFTTTGFEALSIPILSVWAYKIFELIRGKTLQGAKEQANENLLEQQKLKINTLEVKVTKLASEHATMQLTLEKQNALITSLIQTAEPEPEPEMANLLASSA